MRYAIVLLLLSITSLCSAAPLGLEACLDPSLLALPTEGAIRLSATTAGDGEGLDYHPLQPGETASILKISGPAVIHRIWSTSGFTDETKLVMKLDGQEHVIWARAKLPAGQEADALRSLDGQSYWSYYPVVVKQSAEFVATDLRPKPAQGATGEVNKFYLQVAHSEGAFSGPEDLAKRALARLGTLMADPLTDTESVEAPRALQQLSLTRGEPVAVKGDENTYVEALILDATGTPIEQLQGTRLLLRSDGAPEPCVDVPIPALFCAFWGLDEHASLYSAVKGDKLVLRFPIPVGKGLTVGLAQYGTGATANTLPVTVITNVATEPLPYRFCAQYETRVSRRGEPLTLLQVEGEGTYVGTAVSGDALWHRKFTFLEGNEQIYVDGAEAPTWEGTGTEDFFNGAWYFSAGVNSRSFHGLPHFDEGPPPRMAAYRYLLSDRIGFSTSLRVDMQHGSRNSSPDIYYRWVSYWYQKPPCSVKEPLEVEAPKDPMAGPADTATTDNGLPHHSNRPTPLVLALSAIIALIVVIVVVRLRNKANG